MRSTYILSAHRWPSSQRQPNALQKFSRTSGLFSRPMRVPVMLTSLRGRALMKVISIGLSPPLQVGHTRFWYLRFLDTLSNSPILPPGDGMRIWDNKCLFEERKKLVWTRTRYHAAAIHCTRRGTWQPNASPPQLFPYRSVPTTQFPPLSSRHSIPATRFPPLISHHSPCASSAP